MEKKPHTESEMVNAVKELKGDYSVPSGWPQHPYKNAAGDVPGAPVMYTQPQDPEDVCAGYGYSNAEDFAEDVFFYHSDHLGSTSYVTDGDGNATQFVAYTPFGETLVDEHAVTYESPYKFNGKEMDAETGLYYYGARYYAPSLALWYGVDALAEKYPSLGGYVYCANNPVRLVDPDGREVDWVESANGCIYWDENVTSQATTKEGEKYLGKSGWAINEETGDAVHYKKDGTKIAHSQHISEFTVTPDEAYMTDNPSYSSNNVTGIYWNDRDLKIWNGLKNSNCPISISIKNQIKTGNFGYLSAENFWDAYGETLGMLIVAKLYIGMMLDINSGPECRLLVNRAYSYVPVCGKVDNSMYAFNSSSSMCTPKFSEFWQVNKRSFYRATNSRVIARRAAYEAYKKKYGK